jgi:hypothetical protein
MNPAVGRHFGETSKLANVFAYVMSSRAALSQQGIVIQPDLEVCLCRPGALAPAGYARHRPSRYPGAGQCRQHGFAHAAHRLHTRLQLLAGQSCYLRGGSDNQLVDLYPIGY